MIFANKSGVYSITHTTSNKKYIGSSINIVKRFSIHKYYLRKGSHPNKKLQSSWDKYGEDFFAFHVLDYCEPEELLICEQQWITSTKPWFNIRKNAENNLGFKHSPETILKLKNKRSRPRLGSHCSKGHEYTEANTYIYKKDYKRCKICHTAAMRMYRED